MAAGDLLIRRNSLDTSNVPNEGAGTLSASWDIVDQQFGNFLYSNPNITLDAGLYLVMYSERFSTTDTTNNQRIEINGEIHISGTGAVGGYGTDYIRKSSGQQDCVVSGYMILDLSVQSDIFIRFDRTDDSTDDGVLRVPDNGGLIILGLDDAHNYGLYSTSASEQTSGSTERILNINTNDRQDTGFSRSGSAVTVSTAGRYLATYSMDLSRTTNGREDFVARITDAGTEIPGTNAYCYSRGTDSTQDGALTWIGIIDLDGGEQLDVRWSAPQSDTVTAAAGAKFQLWQLPAGNDTAIIEATTGDYNANGDFIWDTVAHIDTDSFTATAGNANIDVDTDGPYLGFVTFHQDAPDSVQRAYPIAKLTVEGEISNRASGGAYHRSSGSGVLALTVADAFLANSGDSITTNLEAAGANGSLTNDSAQFALLNLESIFGTYVLPPFIENVAGDNQIITTSLNEPVNGTRFGINQGTGKFEFWSDPSGTIKVVQTVNSWTDSVIDFDFVQGGLTNDSTIYAVVTTDSGTESPALAVYLGVLPLDDYYTIVDNLLPDHWWRFNNDAYADNGSGGLNRPFSIVGAGDGGSFETLPICEQNTHSWLVDGGARRECSNSDLINTATLSARAMGGWIRVTSVDPRLSCIYEEGGSVNNIAIYLGMGNVLIASYADTGDDNVQAFSNFKLAPDRDYHIMFRFNHNEINPEFNLFIDGVKQDSTLGNPLASGDLDAHSGDISIGGAGSTLEVGGTDISFPSQDGTYFANWYTWSDVFPEEDILELFQRGARPDVVISTDSEVNMQADLDTYSGTVRPDTAMAFRILEPSSGIEAPLSLDLDDIQFDDRISIQIEWRGAATLTLINLNGSNADASKCVSSRGGTIEVINPATLTLTGLQNPSEVRVYEAGTTNEVAGEENVTTGIFSSTIQTALVDIAIVALEYQNIRLKNIDTSTNTTLPIQQRLDRNYDNP